MYRYSLLTVYSLRGDCQVCGLLIAESWFVVGYSTPQPFSMLWVYVGAWDAFAKHSECGALHSGRLWAFLTITATTFMHILCKYQV